MAKVAMALAGGANWLAKWPSPELLEFPSSRFAISRNFRALAGYASEQFAEDTRDHIGLGNVECPERPDSP